MLFNKVHWWREPWMWLVVGGPAMVIVAALYTAKLAYFGADKVVAENYYKQGLIVNQDIRRDARARQKKMMLRAQFDPIHSQLSLFLESEDILPSSVLVSVAQSVSTFSVHEVVRRTVLQQSAPGIYQGRIVLDLTEKNINALRWHVKVEADDWRLVGDWSDPVRTPLYLKAEQ